MAETLTLRSAALITGIAYLLMPITIAEFAIYPRLVIAGNASQTIQNIAAHGPLFALAIVCYLVTLILDIIIAWSLYNLLAPVHRPLSLLAAWFRIVFAAVGLVALLNLVDVYRLVSSPSYAKAFGASQFQAQVLYLLGAYRGETLFNLIIFAIHLVLVGGLLIRSGYVPRIIGALLIVDGLIWIVVPLRPYFYPTANLRILFMVSFTELLLPLWLLIRGGRLRPAAYISPTAEALPEST